MESIANGRYIALAPYIPIASTVLAPPVSGVPIMLMVPPMKLPIPTTAAIMPPTHESLPVGSV
jgi:hypothetical protein